MRLIHAVSLVRVQVPRPASIKMVFGLALCERVQVLRPVNMMNTIGAKWRKLKYWLKHGFLSVENVVLVVAIIMCLTWTYQSIKAMSRNWELVERLNTEQKTLQLLRVEVEAAELENEYYTLDEYKELAARKSAGKQLPGEHMVYLPENSEAAKNKYQEKVAVSQEEKHYSNFEKWMMYLFPNN